MQFTVTHPHAKTAIQLATLDRPQRTHVARELRLAGCPRGLYTLARVLRAAQLMDEIQSDHDRTQAAALRAQLDQRFELDQATLRERIAHVAAALRKAA